MRPRQALACLLAGAAIALSGCDEPPAAPRAATPRVVSLAPHLTELAYAAGAGENLVGVVEYSDYPPAARDIRRVGDAFRVDQEALAQLAPDLILAWEGGNPTTLIDELGERGYRVERLPTGRLENIAANLRRIGALTGRAAEADRAAAGFLAELADLRERYATATRLRVFFQVDDQPLYTVNDAHAIGQILTLCGGENVFGGLGSLAASVDVEAVVAADPQVFLTTGDAAQLDAWRRFRSLGAVADGHLYGVTADLIARDSLRIVKGAREVCERLDLAR